MRCAQCNRERVIAPGERLGFRESCEGCGADLHSCVHCAHHDPGAHNDCREPSAEFVREREQNNYCDWFRASEREGGDGSGREKALTDLDALFKK